LQSADIRKQLLFLRASGDTQLLLSCESASGITNGSSSHVSPCNTSVTSPSKCFPLFCMMTFWNSFDSVLISTAMCQRHHTGLCYCSLWPLVFTFRGIFFLNSTLTIIPVSFGFLLAFQ
jgi:hypothetical protein